MTSRKHFYKRDLHNVTRRRMSVLWTGMIFRGARLLIRISHICVWASFSSPSPSSPRRCSRNTVLCPIPTRILTPVCPLKIQIPTSIQVSNIWRVLSTFHTHLKPKSGVVTVFMSKLHSDRGIVTKPSMCFYHNRTSQQRDPAAWSSEYLLHIITLTEHI